MNLEKLKIKNINSFMGEFEIDFAKFKNDLFLISGPTGGGKTTIIDSILAALYDKTPRLAYSKFLLNEDSDEGRIELDFWIGNDKYEIKWSVKRKKSGEINNVKRTLYKNGKLISDKKSEIQSEIVKALKLDFPEFTKAIVLAQGEFDAFLSAGDKEKTQVLEKILNVKEYELISKRIYQKTAELKSQISDLGEKLEDLGEVGELEKKENELKVKIKKVKSLNKELEEVEKLLKKKNDKDSLNESIKKTVKELETLVKKQKDLKEELKSFDFEGKEKEFFDFKKEYQTKTSELEKIIEQVINYESLQNVLADIEKDRKKTSKFIENLKRSLKEKKNALAELEKKISKIKIVEDKRLKNFDEIWESYARLKAQREEFLKKRNEKTGVSKELKELQDELKNLIAEKEEKEEKLNYLKAKVLVLEYEEERKNLKEGEPCPLCGSRHHPYLTNPPKIKEEVKNEYIKTKKELEEIEKKVTKTQNEIEIKGGILKRIDSELEGILKQGHEISNEFKKYGIEEGEIESLKKIKDQNEKNQKKLNDLLLKKTQLLSEIENLQQNIRSKEEELSALTEKIKQTESEIENIAQTPGFDKEARAKKKNLVNLYEKKEKAFNEAKDKFNKIGSEIKANESLIKKLQADIEKLQKEYDAIEDVEIKTDKSELKKQIDDLNVLIGSLQKEVENLKEKNEQKNTLKKKIEELSEKYKIYEELNKAIGSATGDKFKRIAINYLMNTLLEIANYHLQKITNGRYLFEKSEDVEKLSLFVIDRFYENKKRDVATLSGGEKFLASLSLSFALSDMVRDRVEMEVMFLDEGFGTLDNDSLYNALNVLKEASRGKSVGIISHVDSLKEEITKQIRVKKLPNGRSKIEIKD
ncbi:MAG: SMC family ATPase [Epsilonproteobacteria bacterium]|nr:SMC family ATPase [Campylobacterota bacterium]